MVRKNELLANYLIPLDSPPAYTKKILSYSRLTEGRKFTWDFKGGRRRLGAALEKCRRITLGGLSSWSCWTMSETTLVEFISVTNSPNLCASSAAFCWSAGDAVDGGNGACEISAGLFVSSSGCVAFIALRKHSSLENGILPGKLQVTVPTHV